MKHYLMTLAALTLMALPVFTACTKDNPATSFDATITVNPEPLYVELGMEGIHLLFMQEKITVVDSVLIYNQEGHLVNKLGAETSMSLSPMTIEAGDLPVGTYTLVAWQTIIAHLNGKDLQGWHLVGESELSTVSIMANANPISYIYALGYDSSTMTIQNGAANVSLTPKAMGSNIDLNVINLPGEPVYSKVTLWAGAEQLHPGVRLNPALDENDRYIENTDPDLWNCVAYCHPKYGYTFFTLAHGNDLTMEFWGERKDGGEEDYLGSLGPVKLGAGEYFTCYLNYQTRMWQAPFFGAKEDIYQWLDDGKSKTLNFNPLLQWGCSIAEVERHLQSKVWWQDGNEKLEYWEDPFQSWHKWYWVDAENKITEQYLFETEDGKNLRYVYCACWDNTVPADEFVSALYDQGFRLTGEMVEFDGETFERLLSADGETEVLYNTDEDGYSQAIYRPMKRSRPVTEFPYSQDFENGLGSWTVIDANNDGISWTLEPSSTYLPARSGDRLAVSFSWVGEGFQADDYLVSPEIVLPAGQTITLSWWFRVEPMYPDDKFAVMLWGNDTGRTTLIDITPTAENGDWTQQTIDISAYAGQSIWLAFHHHGKDNNYIALDDILITVADNSMSFGD